MAGVAVAEAVAEVGAGEVVVAVAVGVVVVVAAAAACEGGIREFASQPQVRRLGVEDSARVAAMVENGRNCSREQEPGWKRKRARSTVKRGCFRARLSRGEWGMESEALGSAT